ncbi:MAG: hypothetical protein JSV92_03415 [archaeon]|nr:MAG: hypothetical protein JSV92_03415 [archaeon]
MEKEKLKARELLIQKVRSGEIKCPISDDPNCLECKYLRTCASKLED